MPARGGERARRDQVLTSEQRRPGPPDQPMPATTTDESRAASSLTTFPLYPAHNAVNVCHRLNPRVAIRFQRAELCQQGPALLFLFAADQVAHHITCAGKAVRVLFRFQPDQLTLSQRDIQRCSNAHKVTAWRKPSGFANTELTSLAYRLLMRESIEQKIRALQKQKHALMAVVLGEEMFAQSLIRLLDKRGETARCVGGAGRDG